jgi:hypothetical protein
MSSETTAKVADIKKALSVPNPVAVLPHHFKLDATYAVRTSYVEAQPGVKYEDCLKLEFWSHVARHLVEGQRVLVDAKDGSFSAQLRVMSTKGATPDKPVIRVLPEWVRREQAVEQPAVAGEDDFRVHWAGGAKFRITRKSDETTLSEGHASKELAYEALRTYLRQDKAA